MRRLLLTSILAIIVTAIAVTTPQAAADNNADTSSSRQYLVAGVAFDNLENLFDTINSNEDMALARVPINIGKKSETSPKPYPRLTLPKLHSDLP